MIRILLVEDDPAWLRLLLRLLGKQQDFTILGVARTREEAVQMSLSLEVDVVLMDIQMSEHEEEGIYAAFEIHELTGNVKVIMLSELSEVDVLIRSFLEGAIFYVPKSHLSRLADVIRSVLISPNSLKI